MKQLRIIFFSGKGGVGKTTTAAATALHAASLGYRTIVISTDPSHSLSDTFQINLTHVVQKITTNLDGIEIDAFHELDNNWGQIKDYLSSLIVTLGADDAIAGELAIIPGMDNVFSLLRIKEFYDSGNYEVLIIDMAPTGESLRLLSLPQIVSMALKITRYLEKYIVSPVIRPASKMSKSLRAVIAPESVTHSWELVLEKLLDMRRLFEHQSLTSTRIVLNPEKMVINESQRAWTYLNLFGMITDQIIINRVIPKDGLKGYFKDWQVTQQKYLKMIYDNFSPLPITEVPYLKDEVIGISRLSQLGKMIYGDRDPTHVFYADKPIRIYSTKKEKIFAIKVPFVENNKIDVTTRGNELIIGIGNQMRSFVLPDSLSLLQTEAAEYNDGWLEIKFKKK
ncbi:ArsA family ATPase [bacterium]|nr:ArsA family ATPase [bacterium]